jgi:hypothetical protein
VERYPIGPAKLRQRSRPNRVRLIGAASLPDSGNVVNIYAKKSHKSNDTRAPRAGKWADFPAETGMARLSRCRARI